MDEKVLEEIQFHQETLSHDTHSPLHLIREKEMEISGRVLAAKKQAEDIVAAARKKAVDIVAKAEDEGKRLAAEREKKVLAELEAEIADIKAGAEADVETLRSTVKDRIDDATQYVVRAITEV